MGPNCVVAMFYCAAQLLCTYYTVLLSHQKVLVKASLLELLCHHREGKHVHLFRFHTPARKWVKSLDSKVVVLFSITADDLKRHLSCLVRHLSPSSPALRALSWATRPKGTAVYLAMLSFEPRGTRPIGVQVQVHTHPVGRMRFSVKLPPVHVDRPAAVGNVYRP